ncbi:U3 small nucleolar RNA-associated protein 4 [Geosmithia morbida]|uniref:U3 small nucleolar RNA-associated protein 4 n=1 Tax=Geosmithia morbida TaxID=1094350 RepID=A0A9P4Z026_9HYPO|nr:U3 small nucleolar RNA-associated protein 4 [Geosmithia morbida]KAF4124942.1 U3 small nucleolar RNA-associated protein 4 [Geosmithia morbida]
MDVHRCRFVPFQPSAINAIALSHPRTRTAKHANVARMAIGRANGDIEIWNPANGSWHQELIIRGGKDRSIDGLVWVNEPDQDLGDGRTLVGRSRLFSIGYTSTVTEWDLETAKPKRHASGQHGDIWCIAAQPSDASGSATINGAVGNASAGGTKLVAGTIDGELVMYSVEDDDLRFQRVVVRSPTKKAQMVSITFQTRKVVVVGCSDGTVRAYDIAKGHLLRRMTLGADAGSGPGGSKDIIAWSVQCLPNGNIVSADSTGQVCIWDGKTYTQTQRLQSHKQDVLSLAISADGSSILSGGMDRRTVLYKLNGSRWAKVWGRRYHDHDVKAMASFESGHISVVISGGPDANPVIVPLKEMGRENHRVISNLPQQPPIASARKARFILSWWDRELHIWQLRRAASDIINSMDDDSGENGDLSQNRKLLKTIVVKGDSNISDATINDEGTLVVVSTATDVKAFRLEHSEHPVTKPSDLKLWTVSVMSQELSKNGASKVQLSPDGSWLATVQDGQRILVTRIQQPDSSSDNADDDDDRSPATQTRRLTRLRRQIPRYMQNGGLGKYDRTVAHVAFSADSKVLATADLAGYIDTWVLRGSQGRANGAGENEAEAVASESGGSDDDDDDDDDETTTGGGGEDGSSWVRNANGKLLPKLPGSPAVLAFAPGGGSESSGAGDDDHTLLAITSSWNVLAFHALQGSLTPWSRRHPRKALPAPILDLLDIPKAVFWQGASRVWIYGVSFLVMLDMSQDLRQPTVGQDGQVLTVSSLKRKRTGHGTGAGGRMTQSNLTPHQITRHVDGREENVVDAAAVKNGGRGGGGKRYHDDDDDDDGDGDDDDDDDDDSSNQEDGVRPGSSLEVSGAGAAGQPKAWWMTYKYRPIFGVVGLEEDEVALVERPTWDVDMQERYMVEDR